MVSIIVVTFKNTVVYLDHVMMDYGGGLLKLHIFQRIKNSFHAQNERRTTLKNALLENWSRKHIKNSSV